MQTLKNIQNFITPFFLTVLSLIKILISSKKASSLPKRINSTCIILGNGPSLQTSILKSFKSVKEADLICVNYFPLTDLFIELKPRFFVACDSVLWDKNYNPDLVIKSEKMFDHMNNIVDWDFYLFIPSSSKNIGDWQQRVYKNRHIHILYYNLTPIEGVRKINFYLYSVALGMPRPHNVLIPSIVHAINLNYKKIFLFGVDHSWLNEISINEENEVMVGLHHFYNENATNHPIRKSKSESMKLHEVLETFATVFKGYHELNEFSKSKNIQIFNSTPNSFIDAFIRKDLQD